MGIAVKIEKLTELEKQKVKKMLDELNEIGPDGLVDWNIRAHTLIVFIAMRNPQVIFEVPAANERVKRSGVS